MLRYSELLRQCGGKKLRFPVVNACYTHYTGQRR